MLGTFLKGASGGIEYVGGRVLGRSGTGDRFTVSLTSLSGGLASAPAAGDLVIIYFGAGSEADENLVVGDGYTEVVELYSDDTFDTNLVVARKFMGVIPDTSIEITSGTKDNDNAGAIAIQVWRGVNTTTPLDVLQSTATGTNSVLCDPPSIFPVTSGAVIVSGGAGGHNIANSDITYSSSDLTDFISVTGVDIFCCTIGLGYHVWSSGSFNPAAFTFSGADDIQFSSAAVTLALRPEL